MPLSCRTMVEKICRMPHWLVHLCRRLDVPGFIPGSLSISPSADFSPLFSATWISVIVAECTTWWVPGGGYLGRWRRELS
jgi:hypothetical protein